MKVLIIMTFVIIGFTSLAIADIENPYDLCIQNLINTNCTMVTPVSGVCDSYTYDIFTTENDTIIDNFSLSPLREDQYFFHFDQPEGNYIIKLCDQTTREWRVSSACTIREEFDTGLVWLNLGMIFVCLTMILGNILWPLQEEKE